MSEIPIEALNAATEAIAGMAGPPEEIARFALEAAEEVWPHNPPLRDVASTTASSTQVANQDRGYHRFGFGPATVKS